MQSFIDEFLAENCRGEALLAERLNRFVTFRQLALMASAGNEARAGASGQDVNDLSAAARAGGSPAKGRVADQSADEAPVQVRSGRMLVCAPEALRKEAQDWSRKLASQATNDVRVLLCDSLCQDKELCGKRTFRHLGAFHKD